MHDWILEGIGLARRRRVQARRAPAPTRYAVLKAPGHEQAVFAKAYAIDARAEFVRGQAIYGGSVRSGLYRAPKPLELVESQSVILWEYISPLVESRDYLLKGIDHSDKSTRVALFRRFGMALAAVHESLSKLRTERKYSPLSSIRSPYPQLNDHTMQRLNAGPFSPLHWDFVLGNIFMHEVSGSEAEIVVVDAMPNFYLLAESGSDVACPVQLDLAHMIFSVSCHPRFAGWIRDEETSYWSALIDGYREVSRTNIDLATTLASAGEVTLKYQEYRDSVQGRRSIAERVDRTFRLACADKLFDAAKHALGQRELTVSA